MLYMVTTNYLDGAPGIGVFDSYESAFSAIEEYVKDHEELGKLEDNGGGEIFAWDNEEGFYVTFYIEQCYLNTPLI